MDIETNDCSICLEAAEGSSTLALPCGHRFHAACLASMAGAVGTAATTSRRGTLTACPNCRTVSRVAPFTPAAHGIGDRVSALWGYKWYPGVVDDVIHGGSAYKVAWDDDDACNEIPAHHVRRNPAQPTTASQDDSDSGDDAAPPATQPRRRPPRAERRRENAQSPRMPHVGESLAAAEALALAGDLTAIWEAYAKEQTRRERKEQSREQPRKKRAPVVPIGRRPAQGTADGRKKPRAAVAAPPETEAQQWTYLTKYAKGLLKHAANFDVSSGDGVTVVLAIVGAPSSSRMGAQKAAVNVTAAGQRPVMVYAGGADDSSRKRTFEQVMAAVAAAKDGPVEVAQSPGAVSGGTSELAPLAQAVFLGSAGDIEAQFAPKKPRKSAPAPAPAPVVEDA